MITASHAWSNYLQQQTAIHRKLPLTSLLWGSFKLASNYIHICQKRTQSSVCHNLTIELNGPYIYVFILIHVQLARFSCNRKRHGPGNGATLRTYHSQCRAQFSLLQQCNPLYPMVPIATVKGQISKHLQLQLENYITYLPLFARMFNIVHSLVSKSHHQLEISASLANFPNLL